KEKIDLDAAGLPIHWEIDGTAEIGAPVKETFDYAAGQAKWKSLNDSGEAAAKAPLYNPNNSSPWSLGLFLRTLLASPGGKHALLPGGELRLEKIRDVKIGATLAAAYAIWGLDTTPTFVIAANG